MKNSVKLSQEQRGNLQQLISTGHTAARKLMHAWILLRVDESQEGPGWSDEQVHEALEVGLTTIWRVRKRFLKQGLQEALDRQPQPQRPEKRRLDGNGEAHLIALLCAGKPEERARWSMRLLAEKLVQLGEVDHISYECDAFTFVIALAVWPPEAFSSSCSLQRLRSREPGCLPVDSLR